MWFFTSTYFLVSSTSSTNAGDNDVKNYICPTKFSYMFPKWYRPSGGFYQLKKGEVKGRCYTWCQISSKFVNTRCIKNPRGVFLTTCPEMRKVESKLKSAPWWPSWNWKCHLMHNLHFRFQLCHRRSLFKCKHTFYIYGPFVKKTPIRFLKDGLVKKISNKM